MDGGEILLASRCGVIRIITDVVFRIITAVHQKSIIGIHDSRQFAYSATALRIQVLALIVMARTA